jgi:transcriptional regulator with XRE-family HTH domain
VNPEERARAGRAVSERLTDLGRTARQLAAEAGVSLRTVRALLRGERMPQPDTRAHLEKALGWPPGEIWRRARDGLESLRNYTDRELCAELLHRARKREGATR